MVITGIFNMMSTSDLHCIFCSIAQVRRLGLDDSDRDTADDWLDGGHDARSND
eukprot:SAG31_NODE_66_length_28567_cov_30.222698_11_plen_53_part_00